ncbi:hypothetical protein [Prolixibacter denitrificans]|uniref:Uncharacterized protein n=2 Tax=Prolixibacter denitrificans TaxID=1541063 RepID=A0A2P8C7B8_9BACT|nr:hypothetical protein [Prolixibacter denitrificans]PSK80872.1 hypothetical protein CLV93_1127 [Prolixibacter denitrificans]
MMPTMSYRRRKFMFAPLFIVMLAVVSAVAMLLWNALMPDIFNLPEITFWQAAGLQILARLFFGGFRPHGGWPSHSWRNKLREKVAEMTPEERERYFRRIHSRYHHWGPCPEKEKSSEKDKAE